MGCAQSKVDQDEAISRCKDRKQFLSLAASARNAFAAAHSSYSVSLKNTGAALSDYAHAEIPQLSSSTSNPASSSAVNSNPSLSNPISIRPPMDTLPPPPPPLPVEISPLQRSASMPDIPLPQPLKKPLAEVSIQEEEDEEADDEGEDDEEEEEEEEVRSIYSNSNKT